MNLADMNVFQRMHMVKRELCGLGIAKSKFQKHQKYNYRGVDEVLGAISKLHCKYRLDLSLMRLDDMQVKVDSKTYMHCTCVWRITNIDNPSDYNEFCSPGEGQDTSDKASGKLSSYGYKNAMFFKYEIPVLGQTVDEYDPRQDVEEDSHDPNEITKDHSPNPEQKRKIQQMKVDNTSEQDKGVDFWYDICLSNQKEVNKYGGLTNENLNTYGDQLTVFRDKVNEGLDKHSEEDYTKYTTLIESSKKTLDDFFGGKKGRDKDSKNPKDKAMNLINQGRSNAANREVEDGILTMMEYGDEAIDPSNLSNTN